MRDELKEKIKRQKFYYHDPGELGEDAFKPLGDDEINDLMQLIDSYALDIVKEAKPTIITEHTDFASQQYNLGYNNSSDQYEFNLIKAFGGDE